MIEQVALNWYLAERGESDPPWHELSKTRKDEIWLRCLLVLDGEVRRSEMTPGDLAIYHGRYRTLETEPPKSFLENIPKGCMYETRKYVLWDCVQGGDLMRSCRLFHSSCIGYHALTNLVVPGQFPTGQLFYVGAWYIETNEIDRPGLGELLSNSTAIFELGGRPQAEQRTIDLLEPQPMGCLIPERQNFCVQLNFYEQGFQRFKDRLITEERDPERDPFRLWVHLEGWQIRSVQ